MRIPYALTVATVAVALMSSCSTSAPYSNILDTTGRGVGFSDYAQYMRAQEELSRIRRAEATQAQAQAQRVAQPPTNAPQYAQSQGANTIGQEAVAAVRGNSNPTAQPLPAAAPMPEQAGAQQQIASGPPLAPGSAGISDQVFTPQPFGTAQQNQLVERDFVPPVQVSATELGQAGGAPNLFVYALSTTHNVGQTLYNRSHPLRWRRWEAACAQFPSQDLAQEAFLAAGGPERDPNHLDPDGDGFACWWDPAPFRQAARTVRARE